MIAAGAGLIGTGAFALAGSLAGAALPRRPRAAVVAAGSVGASLCALGAAIAVLTAGRPFTARVPSLLPLSGVTIWLDPLGAMFIVATAVLTVPVSVYGIGYARSCPAGRTFEATLPLFIGCLLLVPAAGSVTSFLFLWELMALTSLVLVFAEHHHHPAAREAGVWYGVMTQMGLVSILLGLMLFAAHTGGESFVALRAGAPRLSPGLRSTIFGLIFVGFASKAGIVPLHVWLPRAHPEAPSHVSALMSGAMVNLGVYGIVRVGWDLLGGGPPWWGVVLIAAGAISALFGVLHALVATDLKRLLAYSTTENMGLVLIGVGAAGLLAANGDRTLATVAMAAALLQVLNHALFKGLLFLGAGSVLAATGSRDLDRLGGLMRRMPVTGATFAVGTLAIAALPPLNGFVSEWLLLQSLVHSLPSNAVVVGVTMPLAVAAVALTGGLVAATFVKALGTGFLALPRSAAAEAATESPVTMQVGMILLAAGCAVLGLAPRVVGVGLARAVAVLGPVADGAPFRGSTLSVTLAGISASLAPVVLAAGLVGAVVATLGALRLLGAPRSRRRAENWGCGRSVQTARMEYTASSFAEPLTRVFDDVLRPDLDVDISHTVESRYYVEAIRYRHQITDAAETRVYAPLLAGVAWLGRAARGVQNGSVHRYLGYMFVALLVVLVLAR